MYDATELEVTLQVIMARWDIPGLAVGIVQDNAIAYAKGFGVQSLESGKPVTLNSVFCVQSVSKCFVATAIVRLFERGVVELDAPITEYLPYFRMADQRYRQITIRHALSHTSGMPDIEESDYVTWMARPEVDAGAGERFVRGLKSMELIASPGERFSYSNIAYNVLGVLLGRVSNQSFESVMDEQVLTAAGMSSSTFLLADVPADSLVWPHLRSPGMTVNPVYPYHRADAPSSFLHTTVVDMCRWAAISLNRGEHPRRHILSSAGYDLMWTPQAKRGAPPSMREEMGLGWNLGHYRSLRTVSHGGAGFGSTSFLFLLPEENAGAVVMCNEESDACSLVAKAVADVLTGYAPQVTKVSWMVPISRALAEGGSDAAYSRYAELSEDDYYFDAYDLDNLALQLRMAGRVDLAIAVLELAISAHPEHAYSLIELGRLYLRQGEKARAGECLAKALVIEPTNDTAADLLARIQQAKA